MKKLSAVVLTLCLIVPLLIPFASALSLNDGTDALNAQFLDGSFEDGLDYVYYSPVSGSDDGVSYPLLVWLHGMGSGEEPRSQLNWYEFSNWASDEYQSRFDVKGCYLLAVRESASSIHSWTGSSCPLLKTTIDDFIKKQNGRIDKDRIYIAGYSTGGTMVWDMVSQYSSFFAAAVPIAAVFQPTSEEISKLKDTSVWIFSSDNDPYPTADSADARLTFEGLSTVTKRKSGVRFTCVSDARFADGSKRYDLSTGEVTSDSEHFIWEAFTYDMHMVDRVTPYIYTSTVDAAGNSVDFSSPNEGVISWLSAQKKTPAEGSGSSSSSSGSSSIIEQLLLMLQKIITYIVRLFKK